MHIRLLSALIMMIGLFLAPQASAQFGLDTAGAEGRAIEDVQVEGNQRIEEETILSYMTIKPGDNYSALAVDQSLKTLFATGLFGDVDFLLDQNTLIVRVRENPIINRIAFEGNDAQEDEDLVEEVQLRPRIVYTRAKVQADVGRILELYRRGGRFAATVEPKIIELPQNRVNVVFEINEGEKSAVRRIQFIGNEKYDDGDLRSEIATQQTRWWRFFSSNDTYDPDRLLYDRELLRQFYLQNGYADFRVISANAELTRDRKDFFITITVEEGQRYRVGEVNVESEIRDLDPEDLQRLVLPEEGERYNAKLIEETVDAMTDAAGEFGYAFANIRPRIRRDKENLLINITFQVLEAPRVYVERIDIEGNVRTLDRVIRREMRLVEGDAFSSSKVRRSRNRIRALGFFEEVEIDQVEGGDPDRTVLRVTVQEQSTGELSLGAGVSSQESFIGEVSIRERNLLGRGQDLRLALSISGRRQQIDLGFTEPYFLDRNIAAGFDIFHRRSEFDESDFRQTSTGLNLRTVFPITEYIVAALRYQLRNDDIVDESNIINSLFIEEGNFLTSSVGYSLSYDVRDDRLRPTSGYVVILQQDVAGLGGNVRYLRSRLNYDWYTKLPILDEWVFNLSLEVGHIFGLGRDVRINDRFFLGGSKLRGFAQAGVGPRTSVEFGDNALGGNTLFAGSMEVFIPLGALEEFGIRASAFVDFGTVYGVDQDLGVTILSTNDMGQFLDVDGNVVTDPADAEVLQQAVTVLGSGDIRVSAGIGFSWRSPFGPIRFDFAQAIIKEDFDETEFFQFNIGTRF